MSHDINGILVWIAVGVMAIPVVLEVVGGIRAKKRKKNEEAKNFLEAALDDDPATPSGKPYTWEELQRDLHDGKLTFNEIWEKAGGIFPERPKEPVPSAAESVQAPEMSARAAQLQAWFNTRAAETGTLKIVPPPFSPPVVINLKGQTARCTQCNGSGKVIPGGGLYTTPNRLGMVLPPVPAPIGERCRACNGTGYVIITHG